MPVEIKVPPAGESITEVQVSEWTKKVGDQVKADDIIVLIETDKVTLEVPAPVTGTLTSITVEAGADASVGDVIGTMEEGAIATTSAPAAAPAPAPAAPTAPAAQATTVMPAAQRELAQRGLSASDVQATGPGGRLLKEDVLRHEGSPAPAAQAPAPAPAAKAAPAPAAPKPATPGGAREEEIVPMSPMRKKIASRLVEAQQTAALLTTFNEVDMSAVMGLRKTHQDKFVKKYETKLGFMSFFIKATVDALKLVPQINAEIRDNAIVYRHYADIGVAVGGGKGLVVPVIRNAERLSFADIELTIKDFGARAQKNQLQLSELQGGTFTISNGGVYGSLLSTPIINPPQSGILGLHGIKERPVAENGEVVIRPMMYIALTYDHRIVDGKGAVTFLARIKDCIENPARMLLEI
ncbi:MAG: 2-oxoglutarate dehydrogenase complex dihydrolipoyllysine-residue succinyltransferase [Myxococcota bacterium]|nr:2-oxoglutarate dehydrogenase complex dihydrolipoyllysine-residue succinyltransferase [Myxococcota bacterium]